MMLVLGLIHDRGWEPDGWDGPEEEPEPERRRRWRLPWRPLAWLAAWYWLMALVSVFSGWFGGLAGFAVLMAAVALAYWRIERWCSRQYWHGLREHRS
ncbi:MAG: hypothetical protein JO168_09150 [Solirubrobacterales bacterium]|nr:hypothetical protein [Solirubrobacterales bacterium]MBV9715513.1 hypothetical protein [Solirubrobacterales bacterium]